MVQVRVGVFETNSSSTHAVCVANTEYKATLPKSVTFRTAGFGWGLHHYCDFRNKAEYMFSAILDLFPDDRIAEYVESIRAILAKNGVECKFVFPEKRTSSRGKEYWGSFCIDHVSDGDLAQFVEDTVSSEDALMSFLFNDDSYVKTGNDNDGTIPSSSVDYPATVYFKSN